MILSMPQKTRFVRCKCSTKIWHKKFDLTMEGRNFGFSLFRRKASIFLFTDFINEVHVRTETNQIYENGVKDKLKIVATLPE